MKFKIGDKVLVKTGKCSVSCNIWWSTLIDETDIRTIVNINSDSQCVIEDRNGKLEYYYEHFLKFADTAGLKDRMEITTLVQLRNERLGMVFLCPYSDNKKALYDPENGCIIYLHEYSGDLTAEHINYDIVKIKFPDTEENYNLVKDFFNKNINPNEVDWDWERRNPIKKEISIQDVNALLKERYPDVDEFKIKY